MDIDSDSDSESDRDSDSVCPCYHLWFDFIMARLVSTLIQDMLVFARTMRVVTVN